MYRKETRCYENAIDLERALLLVTYSYLSSPSDAYRDLGLDFSSDSRYALETCVAKPDEKYRIS